MIIRIGDETAKALRILELSYPFTEEELKTSYRRLILLYHPDRNKEGEEKTKALTTAYSHLKNLAVPAGDAKKQQKLHEKEKQDMFKVGLWETCKHCYGLGKIRRVHDYRTFCPECVSKGKRPFRIYPCKSCNKSGLYTLKSGRQVKCLTCDGTGFYRYICKVCGGLGMLGKPQQTITEVMCFDCQGYGKIRLQPFNPVIREGAVMI